MEEILKQAMEHLSVSKELLRDARGEHLKTHSLGDYGTYFGDFDQMLVDLSKMRIRLYQIRHELDRASKKK